MTRLGSHSGGIPASAIAATAPPPPPSKLSALQGHILRGEYVDLPVYGRAYLRLLHGVESQEIEGRVLISIAKSRIPLDEQFAFVIDMVRQRFVMASAIRDPDDHSLPFGTLEEWESVDNDLLLSISMVYKDVQDRLDPMGSDHLSDERWSEISEAIEKKNLPQLLSFGVRQLSLWLHCTGFQPGSSPTRKSSSTESSPER